MQTGTIKRWNGDRGYGFIKPDSGGVDVFVHITAFGRAGLDTPDEGQRVAYDIETSERTGKQQATNLRAA